MSIFTFLALGFCLGLVAMDDEWSKKVFNFTKEGWGQVKNGVEVDDDPYDPFKLSPLITNSEVDNPSHWIDLLIDTFESLKQNPSYFSDEGCLAVVKCLQEDEWLLNVSGERWFYTLFTYALSKGYEKTVDWFLEQWKRNREKSRYVNLATPHLVGGVRFYCSPLDIAVICGKDFFVRRIIEVLGVEAFKRESSLFLKEEHTEGVESPTALQWLIYRAAQKWRDVPVEQRTFTFLSSLVNNNECPCGNFSDEQNAYAEVSALVRYVIEKLKNSSFGLDQDRSVDLLSWSSSLTLAAKESLPDIMFTLLVEGASPVDCAGRSFLSFLSDSNRTVFLDFAMQQNKGANVYWPVYEALVALGNEEFLIKFLRKNPPSILGKRDTLIIEDLKGGAGTVIARLLGYSAINVNFDEGNAETIKIRNFYKEFFAKHRIFGNKMGNYFKDKIQCGHDLPELFSLVINQVSFGKNRKLFDELHETMRVCCVDKQINVKLREMFPIIGASHEELIKSVETRGSFAKVLFGIMKQKSIEEGYTQALLKRLIKREFLPPQELDVVTKKLSRPQNTVEFFEKRFTHSENNKKRKSGCTDRLPSKKTKE
ncbi:MAG: hypothetical protein JW725_02005 [Candidatus Babeliaceae bacterium]|nr:hypothetical protein [Candidatus Babeliaceae bacterium]